MEAETLPIYWTILGEVAAVLIGVLLAVIIVIIKDRKKLRDYSSYLKETIKNLKKKLKKHEEKQDKERILELLNALIEYVRNQYQSRYGDEMNASGEGDDSPSVEKFILISGYQTLVAELSALENSNTPDVTWEKIKKELTPLISNYLNPVLLAQQAAQQSSNHDDNDSLKAQLENANQRIDNLEKFKQLYFDLQGRLSSSVKEIEQLNQQIADLAEGSGSDNYTEIMSIIEKNKTHYLNMGQMIGMDKNQHHKSVANDMDYSDELISERKEEIKRLKHQIAQQFEEIWGLKKGLSNPSGEKPSTAQLSNGIETISRNLKDAEMCIETMDMEIQTLSSEIANLKNKLKEQEEAASNISAATTDPANNAAAPEKLEKEIVEKDQMIARFAQESKELMSCITGLEDSNSQQSKVIKALETRLKDGALEKNKELEQKYIQLETAYSSMEAQYLEAMSK